MTAKQLMIAVRKNHPLVGTWAEQDNPFNKTSVTYEIRVNDGCFTVTGIDEETGENLKISRVGWNGESLRFTTYFPPTRYRTSHEMKIVGRGRAAHRVGREHENWIRRSR